jgi:hypothetical protein
VRARAKRRLAGLALAAAVTGAGSAVGCSLGLDKTLIGADAGDDGTTPAEGSTSDSPVKPGDSQAPPSDAKLTVDAGACSKDSDCQAEAAPAGACVTAATCDPTWHVCLLTTCSVGACKAAVCNTGNLSCSIPTTYGFEATRFSVSSGGVGAGIRFSLAAAWPFVFVITTNGVVVYNVVDPTSSDPSMVPLNGVPFIPIAVMALGRRVYFINGTQGQGPTFRQAVAWVDVPQDPLVGSLDAVSAFVGTTAQSVSTVLTNGTDGAFLVYSSGMASPTANVHPPLDDSTTLNAFPNAGMASGAQIIASSGARLVTYRYDGSAQLQNFALINGPATASAQATSEEVPASTADPTGYGPLANQQALATGGDGSLLWTAGVLDLNDAGSSDGVGIARLTWVLADGNAANFDTTNHLDLETYSPPTGSNVVGPPLWLDANTALGLAAASTTSTDSTSVQVVTKTPPTVQSATRTLISVAPGSVGAAASGGFAYLLAQDDPKNQSCSVYIFAPACGGGDQ